ncbi:hypothetical protein [Microlunatus sp. Gsoil 973]|uniref:hypothetical protein n=1 Tax=Microlunatus sp. Gsoil 973 TaxID=2672569 RepID=UPI001E353A45|nr:hypothetical protein [Microlunatus sp. Gsoil 973]
MTHPKRSNVYREPGRFAAWPANYGLWSWGEEVVAIFVSGWIGPDTGLHPRDRSRPFIPVVARSHDGGQSWTHEKFTGRIPGGSQTLSGDEHVGPDLQIGPRLDDRDFVRLSRPIDFTDPETIVLVGRTGIVAGAESWFYVSADRAHTWSGPYRIPRFGQTAVAARTDIVPPRPRRGTLPIDHWQAGRFRGSDPVHLDRGWRPYLRAARLDRRDTCRVRHHAVLRGDQRQNCAVRQALRR